MVLCVDAGNSFVKYTLAGPGRWIRLGTQQTKDAAAGRWPPEARRRRGQLARLDRVVVSSVVPSLNGRLSREIRRETGRRPDFVHYKLEFPFKIRVANPRRLGVDRLCAAVGAVRNGARSAIIVDVGSAITVDLVARGAYRGGLILAGPAIGLHALGELTERLPTIEPTRLARSPRRRFDSTRDSMVAGARVGAVGGIGEAVRFLERALPRRPLTYITGGGADGLVSSLPKSWRFDRELVQRGLYQLWRLNFRDEA
jgi:type III pantothenate kinase